MQYIIFVITYPFIWLFSRLPMRVLYIISDILFVVIFYILGYRKKVVFDNFTMAFPEKTDEEKNKLLKKFFHHFTDIFIETTKAISISKKEILKRYQYKNPDLVNELLKEGKSIVFVAAHHANWEWSVNSPLILNATVKGAYTSIANRYFEKLVKDSRERFGFECYESSKSVKAIYDDFAKKKQGIYLLISDQSPQISKTIYWKSFFGIKVPVHIGAETLAKKFNLSVVFCATKRIKRGYYETEFQLIAKNPTEFLNYEITDKYLKMTEDLVKSQPEFYLWSHKRFKHKDRFTEWEKSKNSKIK